MTTLPTDVSLALRALSKHWVAEAVRKIKAKEVSAKEILGIVQHNELCVGVGTLNQADGNKLVLESLPFDFSPFGIEENPILINYRLGDDLTNNSLIQYILGQSTQMGERTLAGLCCEQHFVELLGLEVKQERIRFKSNRPAEPSGDIWDYDRNNPKVEVLHVKAKGSSEPFTVMLDESPEDLVDEFEFDEHIVSQRRSLTKAIAYAFTKHLPAMVEKELLVYRPHTNARHPEIVTLLNLDITHYEGIKLKLEFEGSKVFIVLEHDKERLPYLIPKALNSRTSFLSEFSDHLKTLFQINQDDKVRIHNLYMESKTGATDYGYLGCSDNCVDIIVAQHVIQSQPNLLLISK